MDCWVVTTDESRKKYIELAIKMAKCIHVGTVVAEPSKVRDQAVGVAQRNPAAIIIDAANPEAIDSVAMAINLIRMQSGDKIRIVLIVDEGTKPGDDLIEEAILYGVKDIVATNAKRLSLDLKARLENPADYSNLEEWREDEVEDKSKTSGFFAAVRPKEVVKEVVVKEVEVIEKVQIVGRPVITIAGITSRVGTTHLALSLAEYFQHTMKLSCGLIVPSKTFEDIEGYYGIDDVVLDSTGKKKGKFDGVIIATEMFAGDISSDVDVVVWDIGIYSPSDPQFKSGSLRLLVSGGAGWEIEPINELLLTEAKEELRNLWIAFTLTPEAEYLEHVDQLEGFTKAMQIDVCTDWAEPRGRKDLPEIAKLAGLSSKEDQ